MLQLDIILLVNTLYYCSLNRRIKTLSWRMLKKSKQKIESTGDIHCQCKKKFEASK